MNEKEITFMQDHFRAYYQRILPSPPDLGAREFGFGWHKKIDYRHKAFGSHREYEAFVLNEAPLFISYSVAYYQFPGKTPIGEKGFLGADLVFDLDKTNTEHQHEPFFCRRCLELLHQETLELKKLLEEDFGFAPQVVFSGQKGFHIHVRSDDVRAFGKEARRQLAEYASAEGLQEQKIFPRTIEALDSRDALKVLARGPSAESKGWAKRVHLTMKEAIEQEDEKKLRSFGLTRKNILYVKQNKAEALRHLAGGRWGAFCEKPNFQNILNEIRFVQTDKAVTFDLSRLIRLPNSLHGSTGFAAKNLDALRSFRPEDVVVFDPKEKVEVIPREDVEFELLGKRRLEKARFATLPLPVAVFLIAQEKAFLP